jgi:tRNA(Arg) A34 adenosine deaminase TadA
MEDNNKFMQRAISLSIENVDKGGGPFGAVIVKDGAIIAEGANRVTPDCDPTAHAEVKAIRAACQKLHDFKLSGCTIYTSCEPCPMCLSAIYWAGIDKIYYANTKKDAESIGFSDNFIYQELSKPLAERAIPMRPLMRHEAQQAFRNWSNKEDKQEY